MTLKHQLPQSIGSQGITGRRKKNGVVGRVKSAQQPQKITNI
jgi:hypothetical protein